MAVHEHKEKAQKNMRYFVITVSDSRDENTEPAVRRLNSCSAAQAITPPATGSSKTSR